MTGAIATAWGALRQVSDKFDGNWLPFTFCMLFALVSIIASKPGRTVGLWAPATFIAALNALTLFGAVIGATNVAT